MDRQKDTGVEALLEHLIEHGADDIAGVFARTFELAMRIERERFLGAGHYERTASRQGYAPSRRCKHRLSGSERQQAQADRHASRHGDGSGSEDRRA